MVRSRTMFNPAQVYVCAFMSIHLPWFSLSHRVQVYSNGMQYVNNVTTKARQKRPMMVISMKQCLRKALSGKIRRYKNRMDTLVMVDSITYANSAM